MSYYEVDIQTTAEAAEVLCELLTDQGALGTSTEDPSDILALLHEPNSLMVTDEAYIDALPDYVLVKAWFQADQLIPRAQMEAKIKSCVQSVIDQIRPYLAVGQGMIDLHLIEEMDWAHAWKAYYHPFHVTDRMVICPSWETYDPQPSEWVMRLDPGMAFGTGTHASTAMILGLLEQVDLTDQTLLDVGCGSGILSIAGALMGAKKVMAIDIDPKAVEVAIENAEMNHVYDRMDIKAGILTDLPKQTYDVIVMNITADVIIPLIQDILDYMDERSQLILSGIFKHRCEDVKKAILNYELKMQQIVTKDDWVAMLVTQS